MKKDIKFLPVDGVLIAIAKEVNELNEAAWNVYLLNRNDFPIENVLLRSKGYGVVKDQKQETSVLRHHYPIVNAGEYAMVEPIDASVFHLSNEFWLSYFVGNQIYDKKFIFVPDSIIDENLIPIPELNLQGILHL